MKQTALRFIGQPGQHLTGIPSRDLSPDETSQLSEEAQKLCLSSGLYQLVKVAPEPVTGPEAKEGEL